MKQKILLIANTISLIFALAMNALAGSGVFNGKSVGDVSARYETLVTPAGYAFSIWGVIYLLLIAFVGYQWYAWKKHKIDENLLRTGFWFTISNLANGFWIAAWLSNFIGLSVLLMLVLLFSLIVLTIQLRLETWDAPVRIIAFVWWPVCIYIGWIVVAAVANVSSFLVSINWNGGIFPPEIWAIAMIVVATTIYLFLIKKRNMREAALVGVWALIAIAVKQWQMNQPVVIAAISSAVILFVAVSIHGYKNRETSPFEKVKRGEV